MHHEFKSTIIQILNHIVSCDDIFMYHISVGQNSVYAINVHVCISNIQTTQNLYILNAIFCVINTLGNLLSLAVFTSRYFRKSFAGWMLAYLALADSLTLITILVPAVTGSDVRCLQLWSDSLCGVMHYFHNVAPVLSSLLCVTFSRVIFVVCQIWSRVHLTNTAAAILSVSPVLVWLAVYSPFWYGVRVVQPGEHIVIFLSSTCVWRHQFAGYLTALTKVRVCFLTVIPIILITVGSVIILTSRRSHKVHVLGKYNKSGGLDNALSKCLLTNNLFFVITNTPAFVLQVVYGLDVMENQLLVYYLRDIVVFLYDISYSINFLLYMMTGSHFRNATKQVLRVRSSQITPLSSITSNK